MPDAPDDFPELREAVRPLCVRFPDACIREID